MGKLIDLDDFIPARASGDNFNWHTDKGSNELNIVLRSFRQVLIGCNAGGGHIPPFKDFIFGLYL